MARIAGVDLPNNKRGEIGLTYIFGIGRSSARKFINAKSAALTLPPRRCVVRRKGRLYIICKKNPKFKMRQG